MSDPSNDSYDLAAAAEIAARLTSEGPAAQDGASKENDGRVRFRGRAAALGRGERGTEGKLRHSEPAPASSTVVGDWDTWEQFTLAVKQVAAADIACVVDAHGFVIAAEGPYAQLEGERVGPRLLVALDQAREIDPSQGKVVSLALGGSWLTAIRSFEHTPPITLVLRTESPLGQSRTTALSTALTQVQRE